jgi:hypothetical protein
MDNPEKLATSVTKDEGKQNKIKRNTICAYTLVWSNLICLPYNVVNPFHIRYEYVITLLFCHAFVGSSIPVSGFFVNTILPSLDYFLTYEGSLTQPGCMETVTWVILNKPLHISHSQVWIYTFHEFCNILFI